MCAISGSSSNACGALLTKETEEPTSYNADRNGSVVSVRRAWWNPFGGGQPAGFFYPRAHRGNFARSARIGIMTSPELVAQQQQQMQDAQNRAGRKWRRRRNESQDSAGWEYSSSSSTKGIVDPGPAGEQGTPGHGGLLPGWGVGWGRIDRGGNPTTEENFQLQDVGHLLR